MLKLMKYEFVHSYRTFLISFVAFLAGCVMLPFVMDGFLSQIPAVSVIFGLGFSFLIIGIILALIISIFINYDRSMFKRPGYLTLTLPVTTTELILSKVLTTIIWLILAMLVLFGGCLLMMLVIAVKEGFFDFPEFIKNMRSLFNQFIDYMMNEPVDLFGNILFGLGDLLIVVSGIYFTLTIVHTKWFRKHQVVLGIIFYIVLNLVIGWITSLLFGNHGTIIMYAFYYLVVGSLLTLATIYAIDHYIEIE